MSIRILVLYLSVAGLSVYAFKDWFVSLCGLIVMMAVIQHEDMPKTMFGIQGMNMWNLLFAVIFVAWLIARRKELLRWDMPRHINVLLIMYLGVVLMGVLRAIFDRSYIEDYTVKSLISEEVINTIKWVLPGILVFDGCRKRQRVVMVLVSLLVMYFLISAQVIKRMPFESALGGGGERIQHTRLKTCASIGFSACDMSPLLGGASWGIFAVVPLVRRKRYKLMVIAASGIVLFGMALTGGRAGYLAWGASGLILCLLKWRKYLLFAPVVVMLLPMIFPGAVDRLLTGTDDTDASGQAVVDDYAATSGRMLIWPVVIDKIGESPVMGYGRLGMKRTGTAEKIMVEFGESFPHPHNMYLETLMDNGFVGSIPIFLFFGIVLFYSASLFRSPDSLCAAIGGLTLALVLAQLIAGMTAQHFYPREGSLGMWVAIFLTIRVYLERERVNKVGLAS